MNNVTKVKPIILTSLTLIVFLGACKQPKANYAIPIFDDKTKTYATTDGKNDAVSATKPSKEKTKDALVNGKGGILSTLPATFKELDLLESIDTVKFKAPVQIFSVEAALWTDDAAKFRYIKLPAGTKLDYSVAARAFTFPEGTLLIKHFAKEKDGTGPMETRVLLKQKSRWEAGAYRWLADGSTKRITEVIQVPADEHFKDGYRYPSEGECQKCHNMATDGALGFTPEQLASSLVNLSSVGIIAADLQKKIATIAAHNDPSDTSLSAEKRALAYIDVNCGTCHRPKGSAAFLLLNEADVDVAVLKAKSLIVPGKLEASQIWVRFSALKNRMPPVSVSVDPLGAEVIKAWILKP